MWRNTISNQQCLKKNYKTKFSISSILKKIKSTNKIMKNQKIKNKNYVGKCRSNS
jgi:hypothetical protein